jgi:PhnB protein
MHAHLDSPKGVLMGSDVPPGSPYQAGGNFAVSVHCKSDEEIDRLFGAVAEGGEVTMPLQDVFWGARFGMLKDRFGVHWMFNYEKPKQG